ncbi:SDR family oxidoreductase [Marispirochaeta sp.]|uniref:SDR family oxidoreductase n=1 Tax=Marispirochaeta sp. TaxID=2038653 RepID=UPI0029C85D7F|nr:SDR family oxidoreductase [Marispirochaeta sp.]
MDLGLKSRKALVTGASSGLGFAAASVLAEEGAELSIVSRSEERIQKAAQTIEAASGVKAAALTADLRNAGDIEKLKAMVGETDILVVSTGGPPGGPLDSFGPDEWKKQYEGLFASVLRLSSAFAPGMRRRGWGRIIYITSVNILNPQLNMAFSNAIRAGIAGLAKSQALEWGKDGVTINCVAPGLFATDRLRELFEPMAKEAGMDLEEYLRRKGEALPVRRIGYPEEMGSLIAYLASERSGYMNGLVLPIDGGQHL